MNSIQHTWSRRRRLYSAVLLAALSPVCLPAQEEADTDAEPEELEAIVFTGSRIERLDAEPINPVTRFSGEDLDSTGFSSVGDALRSLPAISGQSLVSTDAGTSFTPGVSSINLRGLGNNNTLALINGRRAAPFPTPGFNGFQLVVDFNSIPSAALESLEVLKDGASAIYGSDAVAGVVSLNLVDAYDGLTTQVSYGDFTDDGTGYKERKAHVIGGAQEGKFGIVFMADYHETDQVYARDFSFADSANKPGSDDRSSAPPSASLLFITDDNPAAPYDFASLSLATYDTNGDGQLDLNDEMPIVSGYTLADFASSPDQYPDDFVPRYDYQQATGFLPAMRATGFYTRATYDFEDNIQGYAELSFRRMESEIDAAPTPAFFFNENDGLGGTMVLPANNPYNPFGADLTDVRWRMTQVGNRVQDTQADAPRIVLGVKVDEIFGSDWNLDTGYMFTNPSLSNSNPGTVFDSRMAEAMRGVTIDGTEYFLNPFGRNPDILIDYISGNNVTEDTFELSAFDISAGGPIFDIQDRQVQMSVGAEARSESLESIRSSANVAGDIVGGSESSSVFGDRDVNSLYAEIEVPVLEQLTLQFAGRYEDYSDFGDTTKPKVAFKLKPTDWLLIRASYSEAFRAPDLPFLYSSGSVSFTPQFLEDPLRPDAPATQIKQLGGGNPDLGPELTDTYYAGVSLDLTKFIDIEAITELGFEVGYWRYDQTDLIDSLSAREILNNLDAFGQFVNRLPTTDGSIGAIESVSTAFENIGEFATDGFDFGASLAIDGGDFGEFGFGVDGTYLESAETTTNEGLVFDDAGEWNRPELRMNFTTTWKKDDWTVSAFTNFTGSFASDDPDFEDTDEYWRTNLQVAYRGFENNTITVGVNNIFDEEPPLELNDVTGVNYNVHNPTPRFLYVRWKRDW